MLLKISLGLAILVGLATLYFTHVQVGGKIQTLQGDLATVTQAKDQALEAEGKAKEDAKRARASLDQASKELGMTTNLLSQVTRDLDTQRKRADKASTDLATVTEERNESRQELNKWQILGMPPERIRTELETKKKLEDQVSAQREENKLLVGNVQNLTKRLRRYEPAPLPEVPSGTKAKVVAYDFKYDFVVLDIGKKQEPRLEEGATMLINRDGHLVTKVKITSVGENRTIANIMPEWKMDEPMEGDLAISQN
jgi:chromosome segregation ATPase